MIADTLQKIVETTPGAIAAIFMDGDGIAIEQFVGESDVEIEIVAAEFSVRFKSLRTAARTLELGGVNDMTIKMDEATLVVRFLGEYYVVLVLRPEGLTGKGRYQLRATASAFLDML